MLKLREPGPERDVVAILHHGAIVQGVAVFLQLSHPLSRKRTPNSPKMSRFRIRRTRRKANFLKFTVPQLFRCSATRAPLDPRTQNRYMQMEKSQNRNRGLKRPQHTRTRDDGTAAQGLPLRKVRATSQQSPNISIHRADRN